MTTAHADLHTVIFFAKKHPYATVGQAWRQIIASLVFETKCDISLVQEFDEQDQARFTTIMNAFMYRELTLEDIRSAYLEFFPHPEDWKVDGWEN